MDADGLPLVGPGVDYTKVEAINQKRLVGFMNHFITHTASFLNRFSCVCEEKLENLSHRLQQLEITMNLLDAKISSIPGLENVTAPSGSQTSTGETAGAPAAPAPSGAPQAPPAPDAPSAPVDTPAAPPPPEEPANPVSKDPRYAKYFKMVQVGVPEAAIRGKMISEGLDPDLLATPDAPAPPGGTQQNDEDDLSSSEESEDSDDFD